MYTLFQMQSFKFAEFRKERFIIELQSIRNETLFNFDFYKLKKCF